VAKNDPYTGGPQNVKTVIILAIAVAVCVAIAVVFSLISGGLRPQAAGTTPSPSGSTQASGVPSPSALPTPGSVAYNGFDALLDHGLSADQENDAQVAFGKFAKATGIRLTQVAIDPISVKVALHTVNPATNTATFTATVNSKTKYLASLNYHDLTAAQLLLKNANGVQVFDSGDIDVYNGVGD
jgi:hypothetical protein